MFFCNSLAFSMIQQMDVGNLISSSSAFPKSNLCIWKFSFHILLKPHWENFEHYFASMWDECSCTIGWTFFGIAFLWDWNENWPFPVLWPLLNSWDHKEWVTTEWLHFHFHFNSLQPQLHHLQSVALGIDCLQDKTLLSVFVWIRLDFRTTFFF